MTVDLTWTGSQFLDPVAHTADIVTAMGAVDLTTKDETWCDSVAAACARYHGLPDGSVRVAAGATQLIEVLLRKHYRGLVVDVTPGFHLTATICAQAGWHREAAVVREPEELLPALEPYLDRPEAIISLSSPRNPLGYQFALAAITSLLERARGVVVLDEVYVDFADYSALSLIRDHPNLYVVRTFSKAWGLANLRIGFAASAAFAAGATIPLIPNAVSGIAQRAASHLLAHPKSVVESIDAARQARDRMIAALREIPNLFVWPSQSNYLCLETPLAEELAARLAERGYPVRLLHDLKNYPADFPVGLRFTVPCEPHADAVLETVAAVHDRAVIR
ncbi:histidinol-phosphate aminotransferase [Nocardia tenerifensis]|uniref:histidinol-phosphate transaminase n=1 Tax=Nocardia tenerifensis TaxID=228006 RepID=A0A318JX37_9NOCA|nr:aminotransferase class I/II-fold pyridoxal phosphate-dependent enzyme [Nocardia tenerifensis]PXX58135.1 histidinol-phosphate aminotransferase [Nocardia tenerifensis]